MLQLLLMSPDKILIFVQDLGGSHILMFASITVSTNKAASVTYVVKSVSLSVSCLLVHSSRVKRANLGPIIKLSPYSSYFSLIE